DSFIYQPSRQFDVKPGCKDYALTLGSLRFRANQLVTRGRMRWVMRLLPSNIPTTDQIGLPDQALKAYLEAKNGLILVCGATESGKTTTIASLIKARAERRREHIITFEDPVEYVFPENLPSLVTQREMGTDELDFASSLKASLRQAPDIIVVGEIRDGASAEIALQAAETGHVVVATMHTSSAAQTVQRFLKLIPSERQENAMLSFADSFRMILCQQLLFSEEHQQRFPIHEILLSYDSINGMIRRGDFKRLDHELETGTSKGLQTFEQSLKDRAEIGFRPNTTPVTGYSPAEVTAYLRAQEVVLPN
ncbi:MAG: ATPase, T2SS/T4P/T4SS family, partial [Verrucomicrobiota bacterium]